MGGIFPRLPEIQRGLGVAEGALGLALIGAACGTLVSLTFAAPWLERVGYRRALLGLTALLPVCYVLASCAASPLALFVLLVPAGLCIGAIEIMVNLEADRVEHQTGRRFMNRAHGYWSIGFFVAGLFGAALSQWGVSPTVHLGTVTGLVWLGLVVLMGRFDAAPHRHAAPAAAAPARWARPSWGVLRLVALALSAMVLEGAAADWSAIYMRDVFGAAPFLAGLAVAAGPLAQAGARLLADRYVDRYQPAAVARVMLAVLGVGAALVTAAPRGSVALVGFVLMGLGTSGIFPLAMSAAAPAHRPPGSDQRRGAGPDLVRRLPARAAAAGRGGAGVRHPLVVRGRPAVGAAQPGRGRGAEGSVMRRVGGDGLRCRGAGHDPGALKSSGQPREATMTLQQFQDLRIWHLRQGHRHPVERSIWDAVVTIWMSGWIGAPAAFLLHLGWAEATCIAVWFLPGLYVAARRRLHVRRRLRCDWIVALR